MEHEASQQTSTHGRGEGRVPPGGGQFTGAAGTGNKKAGPVGKALTPQTRHGLRQECFQPLPRLGQVNYQSH